MTSKQHPLVVYLNTCYNQPYNPDFQGFLDRCCGDMRMVSYDRIPEDQYSMVEGFVITGYPHFQVNGELMNKFPNLRVISCSSSGAEHVDIEEATKRGIKIGNVKRAVRDGTADLAFALLLASARNVVQGDALCKSSNSQKFDPSWLGQHVTGSTLGIVGLGSIGAAVAQRAQGFKMRTIYCGRSRKEDLESELGVEYCHSLKDLLKQADFVVLCVRYTPETKHMISAKELSCMKPSSILINIARGGLINQDDLVTALKSGQIYAAALDVTTPEPLPRDHPLLALPNVILTPHSGTSTKITTNNIFTLCQENLLAGLKGEPLPSPAN